ncbi:SH3 domain-containing kinase-binding protein 1-like isoform X2 [Neocloeon triangulifer]|uniref:SH3 domain-containing kinase-binding protein 1-like isoform X2 n=1 Tax=Neocloeon triangulifer TaxID=2078957 RepID=UPI00286F6508|nr:SH3 domain-containing kinase-binding protein 1-like isoform X2 [Neocloeon triangulifer]
MVEAIVEFNYKAEQPDELTLNKGDIIQNIVQQEGGWWSGMLNGRKGVFPDNFVRVLEKKDRRKCIVLFNYNPANSDELELLVDQEIEILDEVEEGWWKGKLGEKVGVFPSNFVKVLPEPKKIDSPPKLEAKKENMEKKKSPILSQKAPSKILVMETCRATFTYKAVNNDELNLEVGDIITILSKDTLEKGWWKGELKGKVGVFPDNFVELIKSDSSSLRKKISDTKKPAPEPTIEDKSSALSKTPPLLPKKPKAPPPQDAQSISNELKKTDNKAPAPEPKQTIPEPKIIPPFEHKFTPPAAVESKIPVIEKSRASNDFDSVQRGDLLQQPERPKAPKRRPPSTVLKQNGHGDSNDDEAEDDAVDEVKPVPDMELKPQKLDLKKAPFMQELKGAVSQVKKPPPAKPRPASFGLALSAPAPPTSPRKSPLAEELKIPDKPVAEKRSPVVENIPKPEIPKPEPVKFEAPKAEVPKAEAPKIADLKKPLSLEERVKELEETVKKLAAALRDETRNRLRLEEEVERLSSRVVQI